MVNRMNIDTHREPEKFSSSNATAINYISEKQSRKIYRPTDKIRFDDLIASLANAHENRRARQVTEWEKMRHHNFPLSV